jgi:hypothetical protein
MKERNIMKKKVLISIGAVVVAVGIVLAVLFALGVFGGTDVPETEEFSLEGTWIVAAVYNNDVPTFVEGQYMVFTGTDASMYKDDTTTAFATSTYTLDSANKLVLPEISREYKVAKKTDNCVRLYDTATTYTLIIRNDDEGLKNAAIESLDGKWNITLKGDLLNTGEAMAFTNGSLSYFKIDTPEPIMAEYALENNVISIASLNMEMNCYKIDDATLIFIEQSGIVWELSKVEAK